MKLIAIVEDDISLRDNYRGWLEKKGYATAGYSESKKAIEAFKTRLPDLVIIDISLGEEDEGGFDVCKALRRLSQSLPIIFLTAKVSDVDIVKGLILEADDYLIKPISMDHLCARVVALLKRIDARSATEEKVEFIESGSLQVNIAHMTVSWKGIIIPLTVTEFWVVYSLAKIPGHVKSRDQLLDDAHQQHISDDSVISQIKRIRTKFCGIDPKFSAIETVYGGGYGWINDQSTPKH